MSEGQRVTAHASIGANGANEFTVGDFTATDGTSLTSSDAVLVTGYIHDGTVDFNRIGDPDGDGTFEINVAIETRSGAGERADVTHPVTNVAGIEADETSGATVEVTLYGVRVDASKVWVEQNDAVADTNEVSRTTGGRGREEIVVELAMSDSADLERRHDDNDDGTFELDATVESFSGANVIREQELPMTDESGRSNAQMETALTANGGSRDLMLAGTIGVEGV